VSTARKGDTVIPKPLKRWAVTYRDSYGDALDTSTVIARSRSSARMEVARDIADVTDAPIRDLLKCLHVVRDPTPKPDPVPERIAALAATVSDHALDMMRHAVGGPGRNHYFIGIGCDDDRAWENLAGAGLAFAGRTANDDRDRYWHVSDDGRAVVRARAERVL
jgi:hypothetical protein